jgi:hypothetical protein
MDVYDHRDDWMVELARRANQKGWWLAFDIKDLGYLGMETESCEALNWELAYIPGLLQIEDYIRALFQAVPGRGAEQFENDVKARLFRQERLAHSEAPLRLAAIVDEAVLTRPIGGVEVLKAQLKHLVDAADLPTVCLQVLPHSPRAHPGMRGGFTILRFTEEEDPDLLYVDQVAGSVQAEEPEQVREAKLVFDRLRSEALSPSESAAFIERIAGQL